MSASSISVRELWGLPVGDTRRAILDFCGALKWFVISDAGYASLKKPQKRERSIGTRPIISGGEIKWAGEMNISGVRSGFTRVKSEAYSDEVAYQ